jgi:hypothetical protein
MDLAGMLVDTESVYKYMSAQQMQVTMQTPFRVPRCCNPACRRYGKYHVMYYQQMLRSINNNLGFLCRTCAPNKARLLLKRHEMITNGTWPAAIPPQRLPREESRSNKLLEVWKNNPNIHVEFGRICEVNKFKGDPVRQQFYDMLSQQNLGIFATQGRDHAFSRFVKKIGVSLRKRRLPDDCKPPRPKATVDDIEGCKKIHTGTKRIAEFLGHLRGKLGLSYPTVEQTVQLARQLHLKVDEMICEILQ